ncbi:UNVERIFIED_CONTAM: hypothetical protein HDU68_006055 [Siphonaria sp. JEL0065]|nr:hypothetical protein HDU68_006055 [Siphonaria sp. JEL0065]
MNKFELWNKPFHQIPLSRFSTVSSKPVTYKHPSPIAITPTPSPSINPNQQQHLNGHKWSDYTLISPKTRTAITATLKYESMTLVQDSILSVLFGYKKPGTNESPTPSQPAETFKMESLGTNASKIQAVAPTMKIKEYVDSLETRLVQYERPDSDLPSKLYSFDLLVRSKTGTGKTLAFVVAAIETVLKTPNGFKDSTTPILVLAPSPELAAQIKAEASVVLAAHGLKAAMFVGGEDRAKQLKKYTYNNRGYKMILAMPGRFLDVLQNDSIVKKRMRGLKILVYDEVDLLLDHGFQNTMNAIQKLLPPPSTRQTFMFSANFSPEIKLLAAGMLCHDKTVSLDTVLKSQVPTHLTTKQTHIHCPFSLQPQLLLHLLQSHRASTPFPKIIVFFPTTHLTTHLSQVFNTIPGMNIMELQSQMEQRARARVGDQFRASQNGILFTSDVSAKEVDYPDVSLVVQMGVPRNLEQYIHRIGITGRAGKTGSSILVHSSYETPFLLKVLLGTGRLPIKRDTSHDLKLTESWAILKEAYRKGSWPVGSACYAAFLGYYRGLSPYMPLTSETLVRASDEFALGLCGLPQVPKIGSGLLPRLGLNVEDGVKVLTPKEEAELRGSILADPNAVKKKEDSGFSSKESFLPRRGFKASGGASDGRNKEFMRK